LRSREGNQAFLGRPPFPEDPFGMMFRSFDCRRKRWHSRPYETDRNENLDRRSDCEGADCKWYLTGLCLGVQHVLHLGPQSGKPILRCDKKPAGIFPKKQITRTMPAHPLAKARKNLKMVTVVHLICVARPRSLL
jgi:hypothetical protein